MEPGWGAEGAAGTGGDNSSAAAVLQQQRPRPLHHQPPAPQPMDTEDAQQQLLGGSAAGYDPTRSAHEGDVFPGQEPAEGQNHPDSDQDQDDEEEPVQQQQLRWPAALLPGHRPAAPAQPQSMHHGGSFKTYMAHKNLKLQEQFEMQALGQAHAHASTLFAGVSIHVNGLTRPSHGELKQLMALHGGRFETYYHRSRVTHIVCSNLPDTKLKQLAHAR